MHTSVLTQHWLAQQCRRNLVKLKPREGECYMMELEQKSHKSGTWVAQKRLQLPVTERVNVLPEVIDCTRCRKQGCAGRCIGQWFRGVSGLGPGA